MNSPTLLPIADQITASGFAVLCIKKDRVQVESKLPTSQSDLLRMGRNLQLIMMEIEERLHATGGQL